jgi:hypothetical protein
MGTRPSPVSSGAVHAAVIGPFSQPRPNGAHRVAPFGAHRVLTVAPIGVAGLVGVRALPADFASQVLDQRPEWSAFTQSKLAGALTVQPFLALLPVDARLHPAVDRHVLDHPHPLALILDLGFRVQLAYRRRPRRSIIRE